MNPFLAIAAVNGFVAVACGAFAAHGLKAVLTPAMLEIFDTGARYQMYHALAMAVAAQSGRGRMAAPLFLAGTALFSGSLYAYALTAMPFLVWLTPLGGLCFLGGWAALAWAACRR